MGCDHAGRITAEVWVVLVTRSGGGQTITLPRGVLGGRVQLRLGSSFICR